MKFYKKLTKIGTGFWVLIPQKAIKEEELIENDIAEIEIKKISQEKMICYECLLCSSRFCVELNETPYCPTCGAENIDSFVIIESDDDENEIVKEKLCNLTVKEFLSIFKELKGGEENE